MLFIIKTPWFGSESHVCIMWFQRFTHDNKCAKKNFVNFKMLINSPYWDNFLNYLLMNFHKVSMTNSHQPGG
jgi:hypothetical protein